MNRLELAKQVRRDCGISGSENTTANASGEWLDVVGWVDRAWNDIQRARTDWLWMRDSMQFATVAQQAEYDVVSDIGLTDFASWVPRSFRIRTTAANETFLNEWVSYNQFRDTFLIGGNTTSYGYPSDIVVSPTKSLILASPPDSSAYTVSGDYQRTPTALTQDSSTPDMPDRFHMMIAYRAMQFAGVKESASELYEFGMNEYRRMMSELELDQLPGITTSYNFL